MRRHKDGSPASPPRRQKFTELFVKRIRGGATATNYWDSLSRGLVLRVQPKPSKVRSFKVVYRHYGKAQWYHVGSADVVGLQDARRIAAKIMMEALEGKDPVAERKAERGAGSFQELAMRYREEYAKRKNKSWPQAAFLVDHYLLPKWGKLPAKVITRADVRAMMGRIEKPILANQVIAAASAVFSWGVRQEIVAFNPVAGIERNQTRSRERILSDGELPKFWSEFDAFGLIVSSALKVALLTGQRIGEVTSMRLEHVVDGHWEMPGEPQPKIGWKGTKNAQSHRVWLAEPVRAIINELIDDRTAGFVFAANRGKPIARLDSVMREISTKLCPDTPATPHDLRRSFGSMVTAAGFGRQAMDRILNHADSSVGSIYDRHSYQSEDRHIMETIAQRILALATGQEPASNVVQLQRAE